MQEIKNGRDLRNALRAGPYVWPGGYPVYFVTTDGCALSFDAVRDELYQVVWSMRHNCRDGWHIAGCAVNWEDASLVCSHTGKPIESAYGGE